jgi:hypothetical protein
MKIFIPSIGTRLKLLEDWRFDLYDEYRNETLREQHGLPSGGRDERCDPVVLPAGVELIVDRIYIRKGLTDFDSVTFRIAGQSIPGKKVNRVAKRFISYTIDGKTYPAEDYYKIHWLRRQEATINYEEFPYVEKIAKKQVRFWAKLADVNNMNAEVLE